jgi:hypothetical protein
MTLAQLMKKNCSLLEPEVITTWEDTRGIRKGH